MEAKEVFQDDYATEWLFDSAFLYFSAGAFNNNPVEENRLHAEILKWDFVGSRGWGKLAIWDATLRKAVHDIVCHL